jgi:hypothetical protein
MAVWPERFYADPQADLEQILYRPVSVLTTPSDFAYHDLLALVIDLVDHAIVPNANTIDVIEEFATTSRARVIP